MIHEDELITILLAAGALVFIFGNYQKIKKFEGAYLFVAAFFFTLAGWVLTVAEGFLLFSLLNYAEHVSYLFGAIFLLCWVWRITDTGKHS